MAKYSKEKVALEIARLDAFKQVSVELIRNPIVEIVGAFVLVEELQRTGHLGSISGTVLEGLVGGTIVAQQIAPLMPSLAEAGAPLLTTLIPLLSGA